MRTLNTILVTTLLVFYGVTCQAEVVEYDIEIVIFEDAANRYGNSEQWPKIVRELLPDTNTTNSKTPIKIGDSPDAKKSNNINLDNDPAVKAIENDVNSLEKYISKLERSNRYNVLTHKAWRQTGLDAESAIEIYIDSTEDKTGLNNPHSNIPDSNIKGTIKIILGRYLHIYTDMIYQRPDSTYTPNELSADNKGYKEYLIKSHRRMRSNELHYIDHPLVGILVMAHPVELPEAANEETKPEPIKSN